jgi:hypothetical protein
VSLILIPRQPGAEGVRWDLRDVGVGATGLGLGLSAAYSIAKFRQLRLAVAVLIPRMAPGIGYLIPWPMLFTQAGLENTHLVLVLTDLILTLRLTKPGAVAAAIASFIFS